MITVDTVGSIFSVVGACSVVFYCRFILPRNVVPFVLAQLRETEALLDNAGAIGAISSASGYRVTFLILYNQFVQMRTSSHRSPWFYQQLRLAAWEGLTWRLYTLYFRIGAFRREVEMVMDEYQLTSVSVIQNATTTALPAPAAETATPTVYVAEPTPPPPVALS